MSSTRPKSVSPIPSKFCVIGLLSAVMLTCAPAVFANAITEKRRSEKQKRVFFIGALCCELVDRTAADAGMSSSCHIRKDPFDGQLARCRPRRLNDPGKLDQIKGGRKS